VASPGNELLPGGSAVDGELPSVITIDAIDMQGAYVPLILTQSNTLVGYYPKKEFQALDSIANVSLLRQGFIGCTPFHSHLAFATHVYHLYTAARGVHPSFSIEAFSRTLCLLYKVC